MVYVDDMKAPYGRMIMCHMLADTTEELLSMAEAIGVNSRWMQDCGTYREHFDISVSRRRIAVIRGAKEVTQRDIGLLLIQKRRILGERLAAL